MQQNLIRLSLSILILVVLSIQLFSQIDIEGSGTLLNIKQDSFTSNIVVIRATGTGAGPTINSGSDLLTLKAPPEGLGQFIEMEQGPVVVARVNTDGSAQFKSIQYPDETIQTTAAIGPAAYGGIKASGSQLSGTLNINSGWDPSQKHYKINLTGLNYKSTEFTTVVTPNSPVADKVWTEDDGSGNLIIKFLDDNFGPTQSDFHFVVYQ